MAHCLQVMTHAGHENGMKIAVHCHAGLGRTGLAIACYLVSAKGFDPKEAVQEVRRGRPGALQTKEQVGFVTIFYQYLQFIRSDTRQPQHFSYGHLSEFTAQQYVTIQHSGKN